MAKVYKGKKKIKQFIRIFVLPSPMMAWSCTHIHSDIHTYRTNVIQHITITITIYLTKKYITHNIAFTKNSLCTTREKIRINPGIKQKKRIFYIYFQVTKQTHRGIEMDVENLILKLKCTLFDYNFGTKILRKAYKGTSSWDFSSKYVFKQKTS